MKLIRIELENFRQYKGHNTISFSSDKDKPVSIIYGANGSGKTTLLNAFRWVLYGTFTNDLERPNEIINNEFWNSQAMGTSVEASVTLVFSHEESNFTAHRKICLDRTEVQKETDSEFVLMETDSLGNTSKVDAPRSKVDSIMPEKLADFFFFNGERIEKLVQPEAYSVVEKSIKRMLGIEHMQDALETMKDSINKFSREFSRAAGGETEILQEKLSQLEHQITENRQRSMTLEENLVQFKIERNHVIESLEKNKVVGELAKQREQIKDDLEATRLDIASIEAALQRKFAGASFVFTKNLVRHFCDYSDELVSAGQLPSGIQKKFIDDLLAQNECICGTPLVENDPKWMLISARRDTAGDVEEQDTWLKIRGRAEMRSQRVKDLQDSIDGNDQKLLATKEKQEILRARLSEINTQIGDQQADDIQALQQKYEALERSIAETNRECGVLAASLQKAEDKLAEVSTEIEERNVQDQRAQLAKRRKTTSDSVMKALENMLEIRTRHARVELDRKIREVFKAISYKNAEPHLSESFRLELFSTDANGNKAPVARSTGENQILSLSFIACMLDYVGTRPSQSTVRDISIGNGGDFPIVMDAAFGSLDQNYQKAVAKALKNLAPQIIVLVSKSQGAGTVHEQLSDAIGTTGVIVAHTTNSANSNEDIELNGRTWPYILTNSGENMAKLVEVK